MCIDGTLLDVLPAGVPFIPQWVNVLTVFPGFALAGLFVRAVLDLPTTRPRLERALLAILGAALLVAAAYLVGAIDYRMQNIVGRPFVVAALLGWLAAAVLRWRDGVSAAAYVLFANLALVIITFIIQLGLFGVLPVVARQVPPALPFAVEAVLLSLALADATRRRTKQVESGAARSVCSTRSCGTRWPSDRVSSPRRSLDPRAPSRRRRSRSATSSTVAIA